MANEMRDKLFELLTDCEIEYAQYLSEECDKAIKGDVTKQLFKRLEFYADRLIENGVVVPPCKVGQIVYIIDEPDYADDYVLAVKVKTIGQEADGLWVNLELPLGMRLSTYVFPNNIGKTVFLTKEDAEQKLKEMRGE